MKEQLKSASPGVYAFLKRTWYRLRRLNPFISSRYVYCGRGQFFNLKPPFGAKKLQPNLFVIGSEKSGTTSLHHYLDQHPEIFMSSPEKEPQYLLPWRFTKQFFRRAHLPVRNHHDVLKNTMLRGYGGQKIIGESTTSYTRGKNAEAHDIPKKIKHIGESVRCIYVLRHPLDRLLSAYKQQIRHDHTTESIGEWVQAHPEHIQTSLYAWQLAQYRKQLSDEQIHVVIYEEFITDPQQTLQELYLFLGVDDSFSPDTEEKYNQAPAQQDVPLPAKLKKELNKQFQQDTKKLAKLMSRELPWSF